MHERVRKIFCRLIFLVAVAAPTLLLLSWSVARNSSFVEQQIRRSWQQQLESTLGLQVTLVAVEHPRPGMVVLREVQLSDAETGVNCGKIAAVRIWKTTEKQIVQLVEPEVRILEATDSWRWVSERLLRRTDLGNLVITTSSIDFGSLPGERPVRFSGTEFACQLRSQADATTLTINIEPPHAEGLPIALQLHRQHQSTVSTQVTLDTAGTTLPCQLLRPLFPQLAALGAEAQFRGQLSAKQTPAGYVMDLAGMFADVDLQHWLEPISAGALTGRAHLHLKQAQIVDDYCIQAQGTLRAENGTVKRALLWQLTSELGLQLIYDLPGEQGVYQRLSCRFDLNETGIQLRGESQGVNAGVILRHPQGILLAEANIPQRFSSQALARTLASPGATGLPLSRSTLRFWREPAASQPVLQAGPEQLPGSTLRR